MRRHRLGKRLRVAIGALFLTGLWPGGAPYAQKMERVEATDTTIVYGAELTPTDVEMLGIDPGAVVARLHRSFLEAVNRDAANGTLDRRTPVLMLKAAANSPSEKLLIDDLVVALGREHNAAWDELGVWPRIEAALETGYELDQPSIRDLSGDEATILEEIRAKWLAWKEVAQRIDGRSYDGDELANFIVGLALRDASYLDDAVESLGVWLGDELVATGHQRWAGIEDEYGTCFCVVFERGERLTYTDPFSAIRKRLEHSEEFDARLLVGAIGAIRTQED